MPLHSYLPLILLTDDNAPNALHLSQHIIDLAADWNARGDISAYVPLPKPPTTYPLTPRGKGVMIWNLPADPQIAANQMHAASIEWAAVKVHDGNTSLVNPQLVDLVAALAAVGIVVWGWGYCYLFDTAGEAAAASDACNKLNLAGYLIDAEGEAAAAGPADAVEFGDALARTLHRGAIGLCSYRYPSLHGDLPWKELLTYCTFHAPQVYWLSDSAPPAPSLQLTRSVKELKALKDIPVVPIGVAAKWQDWQPTPEQLQNFITTADSLKLPGYGWWDFEQAIQHPDWWQVITNAAAG